MTPVTVPNPPQPGDVYKAIVATIFGPDSLVLYLFVLGTLVYAWYSWVKSVGRTTAKIATAAARIPVPMRTRTILLTIGAPTAQVVYIALSFFIASVVPKAIATQGNDDISKADVTKWFATPTVSTVHDIGFWLWFGISVLVVCAGWSKANEGLFGEFFVYISWFLFACGGCAVLIIFTANTAMGWLALVYEGVAVMSMYLPGFCIAAWKSPSEPYPPYTPFNVTAPRR